MPSNRELFLRHMAQTSSAPLLLEIDRAEGVYMYDQNGKAIIDLISGIGVSNVGHRHPRVVQAIHEQTNKYLHLMVYGELIQTPQVKLSQKLCDLLPSTLNSVYLVNSGSEAVEGAMKLAKRHTGRFEIIACHNAYHGSTQGSLSLNGNEYFKEAYRPLLPGIRHIRFGQTEDLQHITTDTAAIILETVQGEAGVRTTTPAYFSALRKKCNETGTLLILDEVQCGFGRTGTFWAFEQFGIVPDILVCAKGMGGGMPIGAFISPQEIMHSLSEDPVLGHITTFGGHPVSCAASLATIDVILSESLVSQVKEKELLFKKHLNHPAIKEIRSCGLLMAAEMENYDTLKMVIDRAIELGVLTDWFLFCDNSMRIAPPLTISHEEIVNTCNIIKQAIKETKA
ncbi:aspartate aminotransferase family protein [Cytophagaceae bacterium ABcell3]|nr:aspartate aminotransferase family protein [Cytophagaceae bacterium ABcell3]